MAKGSASGSSWSVEPTYKIFKDTQIIEACEHVCMFVRTIRRGGRRSNELYNDVIIGADTETSKTAKDLYEKKGKVCAYVPQDNIVVAWTISIRANSANLCTIYGAKPSSFARCLKQLHESMAGDRTNVYFHFLEYDFRFLNLFLFEELGKPVKQLNTKAHYPIFIEFGNGIVLRDSLIIAQKTLERWAEDLDVEHKKAVGKWDYEAFRGQSGEFTTDEFEYIEHDTLALVECLDKIRLNLHKHTYNIPITCTSIVREAVREEGIRHRAHNRFIRIAPDYELYKKLVQMYHGGFTHCNRHFAGQIMEDVTGWDICSSYPTRILVDKVPMERFRHLEDKLDMRVILDNWEDTAFCFTLFAQGVCLRDYDEPMPVLQLSKCIKAVNARCDNGRILEADMIAIVLNEVDFQMIHKQYKFEKQVCYDVYCAQKDYFPRWFRDFVYNTFKEKCMKKGGDPVDYSLAKAKINSLYGCLVQKPCKEDIEEDYDTGMFHEHIFSDDPLQNDILQELHDKEVYEKYLESYNSITPYYWGCWITSCAMLSLMKLGSCVDTEGSESTRGDWLYCDTDSVYATKWNQKKLDAYNAEMRSRMLAQGYGAVEANGKTYWCGVAEYDSHYTEFIGLHSKCYAGKKDSGELSITVAGVPKRGAKCLDGDLNKFKYGFVFDGKTTGKLTHYYINKGKIEVKDGIEYGNSIDLHECDYIIKKVTMEDILQKIGTQDIEMEVHDEAILLHH